MLYLVAANHPSKTKFSSPLTRCKIVDKVAPETYTVEYEDGTQRRAHASLLVAYRKRENYQFGQNNSDLTITDLQITDLPIRDSLITEEAMSAEIAPTVKIPRKRYLLKLAHVNFTFDLQVTVNLDPQIKDMRVIDKLNEDKGSTVDRSAQSAGTCHFVYALQSVNMFRSMCFLIFANVLPIIADDDDDDGWNDLPPPPSTPRISLA